MVVHLAFMIMGGAAESRAVNLEGSRNVFEAAVSAGAKRLVYASSVAAYGFHRDNPQPLTEEVPARGTAGALLLGAEGRGGGAARGHARARSATDAYVFRPCIVAGPRCAAADRQPALHADLRAPAGPGPEAARRRADPQAGAARPRRALPAGPPRRRRQRDARGACSAAAVPGAYNLAGPGQLTVKQLAEELGWYSIPVPELAVDAVAEMVGRLGFLPAQAQWIAAFREPAIMTRPRPGASSAGARATTPCRRCARRSPRRAWTRSSASAPAPRTPAARRRRLRRGERIRAQPRTGREQAGGRRQRQHLLPAAGADRELGASIR